MESFIAIINGIIKKISKHPDNINSRQNNIENVWSGKHFTYTGKSRWNQFKSVADVLNR